MASVGNKKNCFKRFASWMRFCWARFGTLEIFVALFFGIDFLADPWKLAGISLVDLPSPRPTSQLQYPGKWFNEQQTS
jgi:hypothetical protein